MVIMLFAGNCCYATGDNDDNGGKAVTDTLRIIFFLDGKQVPYSVIREKGQNGELGSGTGAANPKDAVRRYGEKFRYGVVFFNSKEKEKTEGK